jgi:tRNA dimethylallyltransferase
MKKLLVICGPTATGKTRLALCLAKKFNGELISADSRQVYKKLDIGTGKDIPKSFEIRNLPACRQGRDLEFKDFKVSYYTNGKIRLWGYGLVEPTEEFSVGQFMKIANVIIDDIEKRGKLPILVGGTGLYIQGVVDGISTASIPKNIKLRKSLKKKSAEELFDQLSKIAPVKAASLNSSDKKNPRRLIRAIEIAQFKAENEALPKYQPNINKRDVLLIGLTAPKKILDEKIARRIEKRIKQGIENEIKNLLKQGIDFDNQSMNALGYKQWAQYKSYLLPNTTCSRRKSDYTGQAIRKKVIKNWKQAEKQYAKRQITWFRKNKKINWFDISKKDWQESVEELTEKWYKL